MLQEFKTQEVTYKVVMLWEADQSKCKEMYFNLLFVLDTVKI